MTLQRRHLSVPGLVDRGRPVLMGVVNVTPDSFSDGGRFLAADAAVEHGLAMLAEGADILDIGGESTRPGATRPLVADELSRVLPVVTQLAAAGAVVSVDTMRAEVARAALDAGARIVNDVSGGLADPDILAVTAAADAGYIAMHWRGHSTVMADRAHYADVVTEVRDELRARVDAALAAGIAEERIAIDPGLGFAKSAEHNWLLLADLDALDFGFPMLVGASRKSFLGALLAAEDGTPRHVSQRENGGVAVTTIAALAGVWGIRVHDVAANLDALRVVEHFHAAGRVEDGHG
ncbi:MAG: dihydropteroate synthase [Marmoricola sp.]